MLELGDVVTITQFKGYWIILDLTDTERVSYLVTGYLPWDNRPTAYAAHCMLIDQDQMEKVL